MCLSCWNNIPINQSDLREKFAVYVKFRVTTSADWVLRHQCYSPFPSDFRDILWDGCAIIKKSHKKIHTKCNKIYK